MALLQAAAERRGTLPPLRAITIDHALRPQSRDEAAFVARTCATLDVAHQTIRLGWTPPTSGIQEAARRERCRIFRGVVQQQPDTIVLTGHTYDDDRETAEMRSHRGTPIVVDGGAISSAVWLYGGWLYRPLLSIERAKLREWLTERGSGWIEDPSNLDDRFERVRVRRALQARAMGGTVPEPDLRAGERRMALNSSAAEVLRSFEVSDHRFVARLCPTDLNDPGVLLAIRIVCGYVGSQTNIPSARRFEASHVRLVRGERKVTFARCVLGSSDSVLSIEPERRVGTEHVPAPQFHPWPTHVPLHDRELANALFGMVGQPLVPNPPVQPPDASGRT